MRNDRFLLRSGKDSVKVVRRLGVPGAEGGAELGAEGGTELGAELGAELPIENEFSEGIGVREAMLS